MDKSSFRREAICNLKSIDKSRALLFDKKINSLLKQIIDIKKPKSVMLYTPMKLEADIRPLIKYLRQKGIRVYVPFMEGKSFRLVKYRLPLQRKKFGIYEPKISRQYRDKYIDIAIVPIVGTDKSFKRVGFGKGMYDRFFEKNGIFIRDIIFVQRLFCFSKDIITQKHDISAHTIITGKDIIRRRLRQSVSYRYSRVLNSISQ